MVSIQESTGIVVKDSSLEIHSTDVHNFGPCKLFVKPKELKTAKTAQDYAWAMTTATTRCQAEFSCMYTTCEQDPKMHMKGK
jgi:hypothetical protein